MSPSFNPLPSSRSGRGNPGRGSTYDRKLPPTSESTHPPTKLFQNQQNITPSSINPSSSHHPATPPLETLRRNINDYLSSTNEVTFPSNAVIGDATPAAVEATIDTSMVDDDDITTAGHNKSPLNVINPNYTARETVVKLEFLLSTKQHPQSMALRAGGILYQMSSDFDNQLKTSNNRGQRTLNFTFDEEKFLHQFNLHYKNYGKSAKKHRYCLIFRINSLVPLSTIRRSPDVAQVSTPPDSSPILGQKM
jgi:hypothetical protein